VTASSLRDGVTRRPQSKKLVTEEPARTLRKLHVDSENETPAQRIRKLPPIAKIREEQKKPRRVQTEKVGSYLEKRYSYSEGGLPFHRASLTEKAATHPSRKEEYYDVSRRVARHEEQSPERNRSRMQRRQSDRHRIRRNRAASTDSGTEKDRGISRGKVKKRSPQKDLNQASLNPGNCPKTENVTSQIRQ